MKKNNSLSSDAKKSLAAMREAFKKLLRQRVHEGVSLSLWKDGKVEVIPAKHLKHRKFRS
jgi:hypothetical protein